MSSKKRKHSKDDDDVSPKTNNNNNANNDDDDERNSHIAWLEMFFKLVLYKSKHNGSCLVGSDDPDNDTTITDKEKNDPETQALAKWVEEQRDFYQKYQRGQVPWTDNGTNHIAALDEIGFVWETKKPTRSTMLLDDEKWNQRFQQLVEYKKAHVGNCNVSQKNDGVLGRWTHQQRIAYNEYQDILAYYREQNPDNNQQQRPPPPPERIPWVNKKNKENKGLKNRRYFGITQERIDKLNSINFQWSLSPRHTPFETRLNELKAFKETHGHCWVPQIYHENRAFGKWVSKMRYQYHLKQQGKKSQLTDERIDALTSAGFEWTSSGSNNNKNTNAAKSTTQNATTDEEDDEAEDQDPLENDLERDNDDAGLQQRLGYSIYQQGYNLGHLGYRPGYTRHSGGHGPAHSHGFGM